MAFDPCHAFVEPANTTDAVRHACGRCGGDKRQPIEDEGDWRDDPRYDDDDRVPGDGDLFGFYQGHEFASRSGE